MQSKVLNHTVLFVKDRKRYISRREFMLIQSLLVHNLFDFLDIKIKDRKLSGIYIMDDFYIFTTNNLTSYLFNTATELINSIYNLDKRNEFNNKTTTAVMRKVEIFIDKLETAQKVVIRKLDTKNSATLKREYINNEVNMKNNKKLFDIYENPHLKIDVFEQKRLEARILNIIKEIITPPTFIL